MIHLRNGNGTFCKARGGYRTGDPWQVTCKECMARLAEIDYIEKLRRRNGV